MRFKGMDLNLFAVFDALMETRSTARAGELLGISQPATSASLARLREYFKDDLLAVKGRRMYPTPFAESLLPKVRKCLRNAEEALSASDQFNPSSSIRRFHIACSDYFAAALFAPLARQFAADAPGLSFALTATDEHTTERLRRGLVDLVINPLEYAIPGMPTEPLYEEDFVLVGWEDNPIFGRDFSIEDVFAHGHVAVALGGGRSVAIGDHQLELLGFSRTVAVTAPSFSVVPWLIEGTMRLAIMHRRLAAQAGRRFAIRSAELPFTLQPIQELAQYHETRATDPGVNWLVDQIRTYALATGRTADERSSHHSKAAPAMSIRPSATNSGL